MSISILSTPQEYSPAYNSITFTVDSDNKAECKFRYIADVYIEGVFITSLKLFPQGVDSWATFEISKILQDFVSFDLQNNLIGFAANPNSICKYQIKFGEEYDNSATCSSPTTIYSNLEVSDFFYSWNGALQYREFASYDSSVYVMGLESSKFLTKSPDGLRIRQDEKFVINFIQTTGSEVDSAEIKTYDFNGDLIDTYIVDNSITTISSTSENLLSFGCGCANLNSATLSTGSQPVIDASVFSYTVQLLTSSTGVSEIKEFKIDKRCKPFEIKRLLWLNRLGGFDSYSFILKNRSTLQIERSEYNKKMGELTVSSPDVSFGYSVGDRGRTTLSVNANRSENYISDWMNESESLWLDELFTSIEVYIVDNIQPLEINSAICKVNSIPYDITGGLYDGGVLDLLIDDGGNTLPFTTFNYTFVTDVNTPFGIAQVGTGTITSSHGGGVYHTNITVNDPGLALVLVGTLTITPILPNELGFIFNGEEELEVGTNFYFEFDSPPACIAAPVSGYGTVNSVDTGVHYTSVLCSIDLGCNATGRLYPYNFDMALTPLIGLDTSFEYKTKNNFKNINHSISFSQAYKINIQRN